jgi:hypothetical protein
VLGIILGGGAGSRLYPLTKKRAKPAVPLGANYRLIDIPISNCLNSNVDKIYCLTQFNSASLNRHLSQAYVWPPPCYSQFCLTMQCCLGWKSLLVWHCLNCVLSWVPLCSRELVDNRETRPVCFVHEGTFYIGVHFLQMVEQLLSAACW